MTSIDELDRRVTRLEQTIDVEIEQVKARRHHIDSSLDDLSVAVKTLQSGQNDQTAFIAQTRWVAVAAFACMLVAVSVALAG